MDYKTFLAAFSSLVLLEMGDKTQLAVIAMTASTGRPWPVFLGGVAGLAAVTALGVIFGQGVVKVIPEYILRRAAATAFIVFGAWMWVRP